MHRLWRLIALCFGVLCCCGPSLFASDIILIHGHIYTGNPKAPWAQALAITGGRIDAVGTDQDILNRKQAKTEVIDLRGRTVVPGFSDSHTHMWFGGLELHGLNLSTPESTVTPEDEPDEVVKRLKSYAADRPNGRVLIARADFSTTPPSTPTRELLDRAVSDRPVIVHNTAEHALWLNSRALTLAGITTSQWKIPRRRETLSAMPAVIPAEICSKRRWQ
jgi:predicted amidohydrolase YtcJ